MYLVPAGYRPGGTPRDYAGATGSLPRLPTPNCSGAADRTRTRILAIDNRAPDLSTTAAWCTRMVSSHPPRLFRPLLIRLSYRCSVLQFWRPVRDSNPVQRSEGPLADPLHHETWRPARDSNPHRAGLEPAIMPLEQRAIQSGWHGWDRTTDHAVNSRALYLLSYMPSVLVGCVGIEPTGPKRQVYSLSRLLNGLPTHV